MKTYIIWGLMECQFLFPTGSKAMPYITVNFEGGQISGYGVTPARYSTDDPYIQGLIEATQWYQKGRIEIAK